MPDSLVKSLIVVELGCEASPFNLAVGRAQAAHGFGCCGAVSFVVGPVADAGQRLCGELALVSPALHRVALQGID